MLSDILKEGIRMKKLWEGYTTNYLKAVYQKEGSIPVSNEENEHEPNILLTIMQNRILNQKDLW